MEMNDLLTAISTVGFPIVMTLLLLYMMNENNKQHKQEMNNISESLNNNTLVIQKLYDHLTGGDRNV